MHLNFFNFNCRSTQLHLDQLQQDLNSSFTADLNEGDSHSDILQQRVCVKTFHLIRLY